MLMASDRTESLSWAKPSLPSSSKSISKALAEKLQLTDNTAASPNLALLTRLVRTVVARGVSEFITWPSRGTPLGEGATYQVKELKSEKFWEKFWAHGSAKNYCVAVKTAKVRIPRNIQDIKISDEEHHRLKVVLFEIEVLSHPAIQKHPNIASLLGFSWDETSGGFAPCLVMDLAMFGNARNFTSKRTLSDREKLSLCRDIASGLDFLHACKIVHGDVKQDNVLIYSDENTKRGFIAKVSDLERSPQSTEGFCYTGTTLYNAPEVQGSCRMHGNSLVAPEQLWLCDVFSFGLLVLEVFCNVSRYEDIAGGGELKGRVENGGGPEGDGALPLAIDLVEKSWSFSRTLLDICRYILQNTLPHSPSDRLLHGWTVIHKHLQGDQGDDDHNSILATRFSPVLDNSSSYSVLEICSHIHGISEEQLGGAIWSDLEHTATNSVVVQEKGSAAFNLFLCYSLGKYAPSKGIREALEYINSAAMLEYGPAFITGKRIFEANNIPVSEVLLRGPEDPDLRQTIRQLEQLPSEEYYCAAVRTFWPRKLRHDALKSLAGLSKGFCASDLVAWIQDQNPRMGSVNFQLYAQEHFLIHHAVGNGSYTACEVLLQLGCNVNSQTPDGMTPLHLACRFAEVEIIRILLRYGADASLNDNNNISPLHWLVLLPDDDIRPIADMLVGQRGGARIMTDSRAEAFFDDLGLEVSKTPLSWAINCRNSAVVQALIDIMINPLIDPSYPPRYLAQAVGIGCAKTTEYLLQYHDFHQNLSAEEKEGLYVHLGSGGSNFTRWLMHGSSHDKAFGKVIDVLDRFDFRLPLISKDLLKPNTFTLLCRAIISYNIPIIKELIRRGASVNDRSTVHTALGWAITTADSFGPAHKVAEVVELLLQHGASTEPETPIHMACASFVPVDVFKLLIAANPGQINTMYHGSTPLVHFLSFDIKDDAFSKVRALVEAGADLDVESWHTGQGMDCCLTALAHSLDNLDWDIAQYLLEHGATIEFGGTRGHRHTVLHLLIFKAFRTQSLNAPGETERLLFVIRRLLAHRIARDKELINILNYDNVSPLRMAVFFGLPRIVEVLLEKRYGICKEIVDDVSQMTSHLTPENAPPFVASDDVLLPKKPGGKSACYSFGDYKRRIDKITTIFGRLKAP